MDVPTPIEKITFSVPELSREILKRMDYESIIDATMTHPLFRDAATNFFWDKEILNMLEFVDIRQMDLFMLQPFKLE